MPRLRIFGQRTGIPESFIHNSATAPQQRLLIASRRPVVIDVPLRSACIERPERAVSEQMAFFQG